MNASYDDRIAAVAACTTLGAPRGTTPLGPVEWSRLAQWLHAHELGPADMLNFEPGQIDDLREAVPKIADLLPAIAERAGTVAMEMEQLEHRGLWVRARFEDEYPERWRSMLKASAPPVVFGAGPMSLLDQDSIAIVGSREISEELMEIAEELGRSVARAGHVLVSGGARGSDNRGMTGAVERGGGVVGVLAGKLEQVSRQRDVRQWIEEGTATIVSHVQPKVGFSVGNAMARNKLIYALSSASIVISTAEGSGGTWAGATENLRRRWSPLLVWTGEGAPPANRALLEKGGIPLEIIPGDGDEFAEMLHQAMCSWSESEVGQLPQQSSFLGE